MDKDEALVYALMKFGRLCPGALFIGKPKLEIEQKEGWWVIRVKHYHDVSGKKPIQHTYWYRTKENKDDAEYECTK